MAAQVAARETAQAEQVAARSTARVATRGTAQAAAQRRLRTDLAARFEEAEAEGSCLLARTSLEDGRLRDARRKGKLVSPAPRVYARPEYWSSLKVSARQVHIIRALARLHPSWVFCDTSAALVHGLSVSNRQLSEVHIATSRRSHSRGGSGVRRHIVESDRPVTIGGIRVTSLERTAFDVARHSDFKGALAVCDSALRVGRLSGRKLIDAFGSMNPHLDGKRRVCEIAELADGRAESGGESIARAAMIELGVMPPELQVPVADPIDGSIVYRADFGWLLARDQWVLGELDGREKYVNPEMTHGREAIDVLADERLRESRVSGTGAKILRFSFADVLNERRFLRMLQMFGVPCGYPVPEVARS